MSEKNGDKARFQKNRKRAVLRRAKARALATLSTQAANAPEKTRKTRS